MLSSFEEQLSRFGLRHLIDGRPGRRGRGLAVGLGPYRTCARKKDNADNADSPEGPKGPPIASPINAVF